MNLITERFSKIGSKPSLSIYNLHEVLSESILYINSRTSDKVLIEIKDWDKLSGINVSVNKPLFAWVIENLCKNAVDAMNGECEIWFEVFLDDSNYIFIDIHDTGKGIPINKQKTMSELFFMGIYFMLKILIFLKLQKMLELQKLIDRLYSFWNNLLMVIKTQGIYTEIYSP